MVLSIHMDHIKIKDPMTMIHRHALQIFLLLGDFRNRMNWTDGEFQSRIEGADELWLLAQLPALKKPRLTRKVLSSHWAKRW